MTVNLLTTERLYRSILPDSAAGKYYFDDIKVGGKIEDSVYIEGENNSWVLKTGDNAQIVSDENTRVDSATITQNGIINLMMGGERAVVFAEVEVGHDFFTKYAAKEPTLITIGRGDNNTIQFRNSRVSEQHAKLTYDGAAWSITNISNTNGTFVNGWRISDCRLASGDVIYIVGLKLIIGSNFFAINNPEGNVVISSDSLSRYLGQQKDQTGRKHSVSKKQFYYRSPKYPLEFTGAEILIDQPPSPQDPDSVPMALMLGPSLTMGFATLGTGALSVTNTLMQGGGLTQALPSMIMSFSMLAGTVLWPIITKKYEKKKKVKINNELRSKYRTYLSGVASEIQKIAEEQTRVINANTVTAEECLKRAAAQGSGLWERMIGQPNFLNLNIGKGTIDADIKIKYQEKKFSPETNDLQEDMLDIARAPVTLNNIPIGISLVENRTMGLLGTKKDTYELLRTLIAQMTVLHSYDELKIALIYDAADEEYFSFAKYIPHFWSNDRSERYIASTVDEIQGLSSFMETKILSRTAVKSNNYSDYGTYYVLISASAALAKSCGCYQQMLALKQGIGFSSIFVTETFERMPKETDCFVKIDQNGAVLYNIRQNREQEFDPERLGAESANKLMAALADLELDFNSNYTLPNSVSFFDMLGAGKVEHLNAPIRWKTNNPTLTLKTPVGLGEDGELFYLDLHQNFHGPHGLIAGMTGSGKSEFVKTFILSLAVNYSPEEVSFLLIDFKGGDLTGAFMYDDNKVVLPHISGVITNLDGAAINRALVSIDSELKTREKQFKLAKDISGEGNMDIYRYQQLYREKLVDTPISHLFIISDEFAQLKTQQPEFMEQLIRTAQVGRSLGVHLILATQKPSGVVNDQIWSNSRFRVCLKVQDKSDSQEMIKRPEAAELKRSGRFYLQVGYNELFVLGQSAYSSGEYIPADDVKSLTGTEVFAIDNLGKTIASEKTKISVGSSEKLPKQIVDTVKYLTKTARDLGETAKPLWLPEMPERIYVDELKAKYPDDDRGVYLDPIVGEYDDLYNQKKHALTIPLSDAGNCLVFGSSGMGKSTFLTTLCYSLIKDHSERELNLYIIDLGAETLKAFENAPHTGGVATINDASAVDAIFELLNEETDKRRGLFADYGGTYQGYCASSDETLPNIVVIINNYAEFSDAYEKYIKELNALSQSGIKYGIYFVVSTYNTSDISYRIRQNFGRSLIMRHNNTSEYYEVVGRTGGLLPAVYKGRGLILLDRPYEFQTAYCTEEQETYRFIRELCSELRANGTPIKKINSEKKENAAINPELPEEVRMETLKVKFSGLDAVPIGLDANTCEVVFVSLTNRVIFPISAKRFSETVRFVKGLRRVISERYETCIIDPNGLLGAKPENCTQELIELNDRIKKRFDEGSGEEIVFIVVGLYDLFDAVDASEPCDEFLNLIDRIKPSDMLRFILVEDESNLKYCKGLNFYKLHIAQQDALWIGDDLNKQESFSVKVGGKTKKVKKNFGYLISDEKPRLVLLASDEGEKTDK